MGWGSTGGGGGGGSSVKVSQVQLDFSEPVLSFSTTAVGVFTEAVSLAGAWHLGDPSGRWAVGANGVLTYTGPSAELAVVASCTLERDEADNGLLLGFSISQNNELAGVQIFTPPVVNVGMGFAKSFLTLPGVHSETPLVVARTVALVSGDTLRPVWGSANLGAGNSGGDALVEVFSMTLTVVS